MSSVSSWLSLDAGDYDDTECYNDDTDAYVRQRMRVTCPACSRVGAPLMSTRTVTLDFGWRWVGFDHKEPFTVLGTRCPGCKAEYRFTIYTPQ